MKCLWEIRQDAPWSTEPLRGCKRFIDKVIRLYDKLNDKEGLTKDFEVIQNKTIKAVTTDLGRMGYNTYVSSLMILTNEYDAKDSITKEDFRLLLTLMNPVAPHITEELNEMMGYKPLCESKWPTWDEDKLTLKTFDIAVQVNGKLRGTITINIDDTEAVIKEKALSNDNVKKHTEGKEIVKVIVIKNKIVNVVVKG